MVQAILADVMNYATGRGRWAHAETQENSEYWSSSRLADHELGEREYYVGRGVGNRSTFSWIEVRSDGCRAQFFCYHFFVFLSCFFVRWGVYVVWN